MNQNHDPQVNTKTQETSSASYSTKKPRFEKLNSGSSRAKKTFSGFMPKAVILVVICALIGLGSGLLGAYAYDQNHGVAATKSAKQQYISNESTLIASIAKDVGQSVVSIDVETQVTGSDFFGVPRTQSQAAAGTGVIISSDGVIMTNRHVVPEGTTTVSVTLADGTVYDNVQVIGRTASSSPLDVAFLKITDLKGKKLVAADLGDSTKVQIGDKVIAIGNALGQFQNTVTEGIISGYGRDVQAGTSASDSENLTDLFQTDAAINEGNSGGPLVNINGEVIGINTAVAGDAQNIGFAIPINELKGLLNSALKNGELKQAYLGVRYVMITGDVANQYKLTVKQGAYIPSGSADQPSVVPGSPAEQAGLKDGDVIVKVNNVTLDKQTSLTGALSQFQSGDKVTLTVVRDGKTITVNTTLGAVPAN